MSNETVQNFNTLINKWSPIVYLHPEEKYFPCSIDWLNANSVLVDHNTQPPTIINPTTNTSLYNISAKYNFERRVGGDIIQAFTSELYPGQIPINQVPIYALVRTKNDKLYITYVFVYAKNGEYSILGLSNAGQHPADIEHITVELNSDGSKLLRVLYSAHAPKDARWVNSDKVPIENGKIVVYSAVNGHGLYPEQGTVFRLFGLTNDYTEKGIKWEPKPVLIFLKDSPYFNVETMGWTAYNSRLGGSTEKGDTSGITGFADKAWIKNLDELDEKFYDPPKIFSTKLSNILILIKDLVVFTIAYFIILYLLKLIDKYVVKKNVGIYDLQDHIITIIIVYVLYQIYKIGGGLLIKKFAPT